MDQYQNTTKEVHRYDLNITQVDAIVPNYLTAYPVRRIRNRISVGFQHVLVLNQNGKLYSTGIPSYGNLGRTNTDSRMLYNLPVQGLDGVDILQFDANYYSNLVLTNDGVYSFGLNDKSQMGTGDRNDRYVAGKVYGFGGQNIVQIAMGRQASYAIDSNGKLWAWGDNTMYGQLGDRTFSEKNRPFPVYSYGAINSTAVVRVCGGGYFALALLANGNMVSFGDNSYGQLGVNNPLISKSGEPLLVVKPSELASKTIVDIQCGYDYAMALTSSGDVYTWGNNNYGQLGDGSSGGKSPIPQKITISGCTVSQIHTKYQSSFALCTSNELYSWGMNSVGQLGRTSNQIPTTTPTRVDPSSFLSSTDDYLGFPKIIEISSNFNNMFLTTSDLSIYGTGSCIDGSKQQFAFFYTTRSSDYGACTSSNIFSLNSMSKMPTFSSISYPVSLRKAQYFEIGTRAYLLQTDTVVPTRPNNGFNMYYKQFADPENSWSIIERNEATNAGFPVSIYNSHFLKADEYVYFFGGFINDEVSNKIYRAPIYDVESGWELCNFTLPYSVASGMTTVINGYIYIFGGITKIYSYNGGELPTLSPTVTNQIIRAPINNLTNWMVVSGKVLPSAIHSASITIIDKYVYLFGGSPSYYSSSQEVYRALITDPSSWEMTFGLLPFFVTNGAFISTGNELLMVGGTASGSLVNGGFMAISKKSQFDPVGSWMASDVFLPSNAAQSLIPVIRNDTVLLYGTELHRSTSYTPHSPKIGRVLKLALDLY